MLQASFQPTRPLRGATASGNAEAEALKKISTHAPLAGRDDAGAERQAGLRLISTHAPLAGRDLSPGKGFGIAVRISTHAPLAGRDRSRPASSRRDGISTHAPLAGRDNKTNERKQEKNKFQPTRPLRGATDNGCASDRPAEKISTHAPLAGRDIMPACKSCISRISTHAPLAGRDRYKAKKPLIVTTFQPTRPLRGATVHGNTARGAIVFQPTRPLRGATMDYGSPDMQHWISTHAPLAGRDRSAAQAAKNLQRFQPTRPLRGATCVRSRMRRARKHFNPRAPCGARRIHSCRN